MDKVLRRHTSRVSGEFEGLLASDAELAVVGFSQRGEITLFDRSAEALFGLTSDEAINTKDLTLFQDDSDFKTLMEKVELDGGACEADLTARSVDEPGKWMPIHATLVRVKQEHNNDVHFLGLFRDDTSRREAERAARDLQERGRRRVQQTEKEAEFLRELLRHTNETIQIGLAVQDLPSGMIAYVNEAFEDATGLARQAILGMTFEQALADFPATRDLVCNYIQRIRESVDAPYDVPPPAHWTVRLKTGEKHIEVYGKPIVVEGHDNQYILLIIEDHTDRERLQTQLVQSEKLAAIGQLAAGIAHEIRNPLSTIYNALYDLQELIENPSRDVEEDINISMEEIKRVQDIINNLLDFARDSGRVSGQAELNEIISQTIRLVDHDLIKRNITVRTSLGEIPGVQISGNALKQILINLITNSTQAMTEMGGGSLDIRTYRSNGRNELPESVRDGRWSSQIRLTPPGVKDDRPLNSTTVFLEVTDSGPGIPQEIISDIFNPFYTTKPPGKGTGLGLSVVHSLIADAGGAVSVSTQQGVGTCFTIELPAVPESSGCE